MVTRKTARAGGNKTSVKMIESQQKRTRAWELRVRGWNIREIARELRVTRETAHRYLIRETEEMATRRRELADHYVDCSLDQIDTVLRRALDLLDAESDMAAAQVVLRAIERKARLLGLDAPTRIEATGAAGAPLVPTPDESAQMAALLADDRIREAYDRAATLVEDVSRGDGGAPLAGALPSGGAPRPRE